MTERSPTWHPASVWVVDDDRSVRFVLAEALREAGYRVQAFDSARNALDALATEAPPELVFTDVRMPGLDGLGFLDALKARGHLLAVATGKSRRGLDEVLQSVELKHVFDGSRTADETAGKPDPLMLHELMAQFDVPAERVLMVGDTTHDLQMALNAACPSVGVSYGAHEPDAFTALRPRHVAHSVRQLHDWLLVNG